MTKKMLGLLMTVTLFLFAISAGFAAGSGETDSDTGTSSAGVPESDYGESPMLSTKVAAGELPSVDERLPMVPRVVQPLVEVGRYGGTLRAYATNMGVEGGDLIEHVDTGDAYLLGYDRAGNIIPNIALDYDFSDDARTLTLHLREGIKWSDGHPFTAEDIVFMFEAMNRNDNISTWAEYPGLDRIIAIDDYTLRYECDQPFPALVNNLASWAGSEWTAFAPKHYLEKWHIDYNDNANELAKEEGFDEWWEAFQYHFGPDPTRDINKPTMMPWMFSQLTTTVKAFERNPYFYQVDIEGNQLPYVDYVTVSIVDKEVYQTKILSGEADVATWYTSAANYPLYKENEASGGYITHSIPGVQSSEAALAINQNHSDPFMRETLQDLRFRQALSVAINREEINETVFFGLGVPSQATALPTARYYKDEWGESYAQFDPAMANRLLDKMGLTERDNDNFRVGPDGKPILMLVEYSDWGGDAIVTIFELVKEYWEDVGLKTALRFAAGDQFNQRAEALDHVIMSHPYTDTGEVGDFGWNGRAAPGSGGLGWCPSWLLWLSANREIKAGRKTLNDYQGGVLPGEEPPESIKQLEAWTQDKMQHKFGSPEYLDLMERIYDFQAENLYVLGTVGLVPTIYIADKDLGNVPTGFPFDKAFFGDLYNDAQQLFYKN
jgi:peptide/nickel transport system substrate-binding protein